MEYLRIIFKRFIFLLFVPVTIFLLILLLRDSLIDNLTVFFWIKFAFILLYLSITIGMAITILKKMQEELKNNDKEACAKIEITELKKQLGELSTLITNKSRVQMATFKDFAEIKDKLIFIGEELKSIKSIVKPDETTFSDETKNDDINIVSQNKIKRILVNYIEINLEGCFQTVSEKKNALYEIIEKDNGKAVYRIREELLETNVKDNIYFYRKTCSISGNQKLKSKIIMKSNGEVEKIDENKWHKIKSAEIEVN